MTLNFENIIKQKKKDNFIFIFSLLDVFNFESNIKNYLTRLVKDHEIQK